MENFVHQELFIKFQEYLNGELELKEKIRAMVREIEQRSKEAAIHLQVIHSSIEKIPQACKDARQCFEKCRESYKELADLIPPGQFYKYCDLWYYVTQRIVFLIALTVYLETDILVTREAVAEVLGMKTSQREGFHLDIEDYLMGVLQMASELSRFATNAVTLGDYKRPLAISHFVAELNSGYRLLNLKNDALRKRFDALKYDVKRIEEVVYDISIRGLAPPPTAGAAAADNPSEEARNDSEKAE